MSTAMPDLEGVRHREVIVRGTRVHVAELGPEDAKPLLLVHGWPQNWWLWRHVAPRLAPEFRCIMPDLPGHGWSGPPAAGYGKESLALDLLAVVDELELGQVAYVGHDWGAWIGFLIAMSEPERLEGLLALGIPHPWPSRRDLRSPGRIAAFVYQLPLAAPGLGYVLMRTGATRRFLPRLAPPGTYTAADLDAFDEPLRSRTGARATVGMYRDFLLLELPRVMRGRYRDRRVELPIRLVVGNRDPITRTGDLKGFEQNAPAMTLERVPTGHFIPDEAPDVVVREIRALFG